MNEILNLWNTILSILQLYVSWPVSNAARKNGLDDNASLLATNDTKAQACTIVDKINNFNLTPVRREQRILKYI